MRIDKRTMTATILASLMTMTGAAYAHGDKAHAKPAGPVKMEQKEWGIAGNAKAVARTIEVHMTDQMRFTPDRIEVRQGETVRLVHRNDGQDHA